MVRFALNLPNFGAFADPHRLVDLARRAEAAGWDGFFLWDHIRAGDWAGPRGWKSGRALDVSGSGRPGLPRVGRRWRLG